MLLGTQFFLLNQHLTEIELRVLHRSHKWRRRCAPFSALKKPYLVQILLTQGKA